MSPFVRMSAHPDEALQKAIVRTLFSTPVTATSLVESRLGHFARLHADDYGDKVMPSVTNIERLHALQWEYSNERRFDKAQLAVQLQRQRRCTQYRLRIAFVTPFIAELFYFKFNNSALFRILVESAAAGAILYGVYGLMQELEQRDVDRGVRIATLFAQIAQTHALPDGKGLKALTPSLEALACEGVPMRNINLRRANLVGANLSGVDLGGADLSGANLLKADLREASLFQADLSGAVLDRANLTEAFMFEANLAHASMVLTTLRGTHLDKSTLRYTNLEDAILEDTGLSEVDFECANLTRALFDKADLSGASFRGANVTGTLFVDVYHLEQTQIDVACAAPNDHPALPNDLTWWRKRCAVTC